MKQALSNAGKPVTLLPNLNLLEHPVSSPSQVITPFYLGPPAPMGVSDIGLGSTPYAYNTTHFLGSVTFNSVPNATNPGGEGVINPVASAFGDQGSPSQFGIQLNTVLTNVSLPGNTNGVFWVQNVLEVNATDVSFDVSLSNFTSSAFTVQTGSILSWTCPNVPLATQVPSGYVQCTNPVPAVPINPADYPLTLGIYTNASLNAANDTVLSYGYSFSGAHGFRATGTEIQYVFNNQIPLSTPLPYLPGFEVNGKTPNAVELDDAEIVLVGIIGGANAVFNTLNSTVQLLHSNATSGGWQASPSAYNFGVDTGETSSSVATTWSTAGTATAYAGPSMLEGLWGSEPQVAVPSTSIEFAGSISPNYGFVFVSNVNPATGQIANFSWVPTTASGTFQTWLPTGTYYVRALADGFDQYNGTSFSSSMTSYSIAMTSRSGTLDQSLQAPVYINGDAQASAFATALGGSGAAPYDFVNLPLGINLTFNHLNEFGFPEFVMFQAMNLSNQVRVSNVYETANDDLYFTNSIATGLIYPQPGLVGGGANFTQEITIYYSSDAYVYSTTFLTAGSNSQNEVFLWGDTGAVTDHITAAALDATAVEVGFSTGTWVQNTNATNGGYGVEDLSSHRTTVWNDTAFLSNGALIAYGSSGGTYSYINATDSAGISAGFTTPGFAYFSVAGINHASFNWFRADGGYPGNISISSFVTWTNSVFTGSSEFLNVYSDWGTTFNTLTVENGATGPWLYGTTYTNITGYTVYNTGIGSNDVSTNNTQVTNLLVNHSGVGIVTGLNLEFGGFPGGMTTSSFTDVTQNASAAAVESLKNLVGTTVSGLTVLNGGEGIAASYFTDFSASTVWAYSGAGVILEHGAGVTLHGINADGGLGAFLEYNTGVTGTGISANASSLGLQAEQESGDVFSGIRATNGSVGLELFAVTGESASSVSASNDSIGVFIEDSSYMTVSGVTVTDLSLGVYIYDSNNVQVNTVAVSDISVGVKIYGSQFDSVSSVTATNATLQSPYLHSGLWGPIAAVDTYFTDAVTISGVTATTYPAGFYDSGSDGLTVTGLNATGGMYGLILNGTYYGVFSAIGAYQDYQGMLLQAGSSENAVTGSSFVDETSYGIAIVSGNDNMIWNNNFIGDNGATSSFDPAHVQAYAGDYNYFYICPGSAFFTCSSGVGNYWADWHTYGANGYLAPYVLSGVAYDEFPIGPQETFTVSFIESGLAAGGSWSVTLGGVTLTATTAEINFTEPMGTYAFQLGSVAGYTVSPSSGSVTLTAATYNVPVMFTAVPTPIFAVTLSAGGLSAGTSWSATVNGVTQSTTGPSLVFYLADGTYSYSFNAVGGYQLPSTGASGSVTVANAPTSVGASYSPVTTTSYVSTDSFDTWLAVAIIIAVIALVVALLAVMLRKGNEKPPAQPWTGSPSSTPSGESETTAPSPPEGAAGDQSWSEAGTESSSAGATR